MMGFMDMVNLAPPASQLAQLRSKQKDLADLERSKREAGEALETAVEIRYAAEKRLDVLLDDVSAGDGEVAGARVDFVTAQQMAGRLQADHEGSDGSIGRLRIEIETLKKQLKGAS